jgi:hypothetical protein
MSESTPSTRKQASNLWKLLSSADKATFAQGLAIAESMGAPMDALLEGISVNERTGELIRNSRFSGTKEAQPQLDRVLLHQLSLAEPQSDIGKLRAQVRKVVISGDGIPVLRGFEGLESLEIILDAPENLNQVPVHQNLSPLGPLPSLKALKIVGQSLGSTSAALKSLAGLQAPALEEVEIGSLALEDIEPLSICKQIKRLNISKSSALISINALKASAHTLEHLDLTDCESIKSLDALKGAIKLHSLYLNDCKSIDSLLPLSDSKSLTDISFNGLIQLKSLAGLVGPFITTQNKRFGEKYLMISGCTALTSLKGLPPLDPEITQVMLYELDALKDLTGLAGTAAVTAVTFRGRSLEDLDALKTFEGLENLIVHGSVALTDLSQLERMSKLEDLELSHCSALTRLPGKWDGPLRSLKLADCDVLQSLGRFPSSLQWLSIAGCRALNVLDGLQDVLELNLSLKSRLIDSQSKATYLTTGSTLAHITKLKVNFEPANELYQQPDQRTTIFPLELATALASIPALTLTVGSEKSSGFSTSLRDVSAIGKISSLKSLDLSACAYVDDLSWVVQLPELSHVQFWPGSDAAKLAGASTHASLDHVRKLQLKLCRKFKIEMPPHLATADKSVAKSTVKTADKSTAAKANKDATALKKLLKGEPENLLQALEIMKSLDDADTVEAVAPELSRAFARLLSSAEPHQVCIGIQALESLHSPAVFDLLAEGVNSDMAYSGDSEAIGKIFKNVKQAEREMARWALTWLLALAPPQASVAVDIRTRLKAINLVQVPRMAQLQAPSLSGFTSLQEVHFDGLLFTDLECLRGLKTILTLKISDCHALTSLQGLQGCDQLKGLSLSDCPSLTDLSVLSGMPELSVSSTAYSYNHSLSLDSGVGISDLRFVTGLKAVHNLELRLSSSADTSPFLECPWIKDVKLTLESWNIDLSSFRHCSSLDIRCRDETGNHRWNYELPLLTNLDVMGGHHQFDELQAPKIEDVGLSMVSVSTLKGLSSCRSFHAGGSTLASLDGLGPVRELRLWDCEINSFNGVESASITVLDLTHGKCAGLTQIGHIATLQTLKFNSELKSAALLELPACPQIRALEIPGYTGSLAFLSTWTSLEELDLRHSGKLTDLDALSGLTALKKIRIRGATIKKDAWPAALKDILDTK